MKTQVLVMLSMLISFPAASRASERCEISQLQANDSLKERARVIRFPDGREIILVGHNHGNRDVPLRLSALSETGSSAFSNPRFAFEVHQILHDNAEAVEHVQEDTRFLRSLLSKNSDIKFVGIEATQTAVDQNLEFFKELRDRFTSQLYQRNIPGSASNYNALLLATGSVNHLKIHEPGLFQGKSLLGPESEKAGQVYEAALAEFDSARDRLKAQAAGDTEYLQKISDTYSELMAIYAAYDPKKHDSLLLDAVRRNTPPKYLAAAESWMRAGLAEMTAMKARDRAMTASMTQRNDSGVLFVGLWHLESLALMVQKQCLEGWGTSGTAVPAKSQKAAQ